jgi:hypothetical protein
MGAAQTSDYDTSANAPVMTVAEKAAAFRKSLIATSTSTSASSSLPTQDDLLERLDRIQLHKQLVEIFKGQLACYTRCHEYTLDRADKVGYNANLIKGSQEFVDKAAENLKFIEAIDPTTTKFTDIACSFVKAASHFAKQTSPHADFKPSDVNSTTKTKDL